MVKIGKILSDIVKQIFSNTFFIRVARFIGEHLYSVMDRQHLAQLYTEAKKFHKTVGS